jgi:hypothetical protein
VTTTSPASMISFTESVSPVHKLGDLHEDVADHGVGPYVASERQRRGLAPLDGRIHCRNQHTHVAVVCSVIDATNRVGVLAHSTPPRSQLVGSKSLDAARPQASRSASRPDNTLDATGLPRPRPPGHCTRVPGARDNDQR